MKIFLISGAVFFVDQLTKWLVKVNLSLGETIRVFGNFFQLTFIKNYGMAFGIAIPNKIFFNLLSIVAAGAILYYIFKFRKERLLPRFSLAVIFGGAVGNLYDRFMNGSVVDFMDMNVPDIQFRSFDLFLFSTPSVNLTRWPIFNVADIAVSVGMFLLVLTIISSNDTWLHSESHEEAISEDDIPLDDQKQQT